MATNKKARNRMLAAKLRKQDITPNGVAWAEAKAVMSHLIDEGLTPATASRAAAKAVAKAGDYTKPEPAPVAQAPTPKAEPKAKALPTQAERVARGEVMRDSKGRIVSREVQEAWEAIASLAHDDKGVTGDYESFAGGRVTA